jgi:hypothetical protein
MATSIMPLPEDYFQVLQTCLDYLLEGEQTIESVLLLYPRSYDQLRPPLEAAAWLYSKKVILNPRPDFIPASRNHIVRHLSSGIRLSPPVKRARGRKTRLVIGKNAVFFSMFGPLLASFLK